MRWIRSIAAVISLSASVGALTSACSELDLMSDCRYNLSLHCDGSAGGAAGAGASTGTVTAPSTGAGSPGESCKTKADCNEGLFCQDDVCCKTACDGPCEGCGQGGECTLLPAGTKDPTSECDALGGCGEAPGTCLCNDGVKNGDETDVDCGGPCKCVTGSKCTNPDGSECQTGFCVDGYCCNAECSGACEACDAAGHPGLCLPVAVGTVDPLCNAPQVCGTAGTCAKPVNESCLSESQCASSQCAVSCQSCLQDLDCTNGKVCIQGACFEKADDGALCPSDLACKSGRCVDGVCCDAECNGPCMACHRSYTEVATGTCKPILSGYDPHDECKGPGRAAACDGAGKCGDP